MTTEKSFLLSITDEIFEKKRKKDIEKDFFQRRFDKKNWNLAHPEIARQMREEKPLYGNLESSITTTMQTVVELFVEQYEPEIRKDEVNPMRWISVSKGGLLHRGGVIPGEGPVSPWGEAYDWLWQYKYRRWLWQQLINRANLGGDRIVFEALNHGADREFVIPKLPKTQLLRGKHYKLRLDLKLDGYLLLLGQGTSGNHYCYCPSQAFAPIGTQVIISEPLYLPQAGAQLECFEPGDLGEENLLVIVTLEQLEPPQGQDGLLGVLPSVTVDYLASLWQQLHSQVKVSLFYKAFEAINGAS